MYILEPVRLVQKEGQPFGLFFFLGYTVGRAAQLFGLKCLGTVKPPLRNSPLCSAFTPHLQRGLEAVLETVHPFHVGASDISLAPTFLQKSERAHFAAPPFQIATACAGLRFGFGCRPGNKSSKLSTCFTSPRTSYRSRRLFFKSHLSLILSRLLFQIEPAALGFDLVLGATLEGMASILFP